MTELKNYPTPKLRSDMEVVLLDRLGDDLTPLRAARVSTIGAEDAVTEEDNVGLRRYLIENYHHVPFEHQVLTVRLAAPLFVIQQLLKHRISSISQESGRYRVLDGEFYLPDTSIRPLIQVGRTGRYEFTPAKHTPINKKLMVESTMRHAIEQAYWAYIKMINEGIAKEVARMILPVNTYSSMVLTMNSRSLMNFFKLRLSHWGQHPQFEIEDLAAQMIMRVWREAYPATVDAWLEANPVTVEHKVEVTISGREFAQAVRQYDRSVR